MNINKNTTFFVPQGFSDPGIYALNGLKRDIFRLFGQDPIIVEQPLANQIRFQVASFDHEEIFQIQSHDDYILIEGNDGLGIIFGIYYFCEKYLVVDPYEFWTDFPYQRKEQIEIPSFSYTSPEPRLRFRGWFINDEDCLMGWHDDMKISLESWEQIFETLLRAGYNMVIPGTAISADAPHLKLASEMGLWITHHHAEPLGAQMFSDVYPGIDPSIPDEMEHFIALYKDGISRYKGLKVVWVLGFRGQGDNAFFENDTRYDTPQKRGSLISEMVKIQKNLVLEMTEGPQIFAHYIYAESVELYRDGHLTLDDDIIRIWADNGFGAMRMRRDWGPEKHISSLPLEKDRKNKNGVYYHVSFHDLQISGKLIPWIAPELICEQFQLLFESGDINFLILNVSNIRPHVFNIELIDHLIRFQTPEPFEDILSTHYKTWAHRHFPAFEIEIQNLIKQYYQTPFQYDTYADSKAGEQVYHPTLRHSIRGAITHETVDHLMQFIPNCPTDNADCFQWLLERAEKSLPHWESLYQEAKNLFDRLSGGAARYFSDSIKKHIDYMFYSCKGFVAGVKGLLAYGNEDYESAFCLFNEGILDMQGAWESLKKSEHGKWMNFYRGEWLTDTRETIRYLEIIRGITKIKGDTDISRSVWMMDALRLKKRSIQTIVQASADYDRLADVLCDKNVNISREDLLIKLFS